MKQPYPLSYTTAHQLPEGFYWEQPERNGFQIIHRSPMGVEVIGEDRVYDAAEIKGLFWNIQKA